MQDITLGKPAKAQLAKPVDGPEKAYHTMKGNEFVVETKFDGAPALEMPPYRLTGGACWTDMPNLKWLLGLCRSTVNHAETQPEL